MRVAKVFQEVQARWRCCSAAMRRKVRSWAMTSKEADFRLRCKIVWNLVRGESPQRISQVLGCSLSQVYRVARRFVEQGEIGLADRREDNGQTKVDESYQAELLRLVAEDSPQDHGYRRPTWTQELLLLVMAQTTGIRISQSRMSRLLGELEIRLGRPKPVVGCPWKKARRTRRLRHLERLIETLPKGEVVVYVDEVDIDLNPKIGPDYMLRGTQKTVVTPGKNQKRYLAGALNPKTGQLTWVEWERKDSDLFFLQLWQLVGHDYPNAKCIHIILDNYSIHSSQRTQIALAALGHRVRLHFLPPYCPDHNRIERVWRDLHDNVTRNHRCHTMEELLQEVRFYLQTRQRALRHEYATRCAA
jgi:transposase